jgi:hypothetical protein
MKILRLFLLIPGRYRLPLTVVNGKKLFPM